MSNVELTERMKSAKILKSFREKDQVNLKTKKGYIFKAGGILSKIDDNKQYLAINGKWVEVDKIDNEVLIW